MSDRCPRCGFEITPAQPPALSRWDNKTHVCSKCGFEEAVAQHWGGEGALNPKTGIREWKTPPKETK